MKRNPVSCHVERSETSLIGVPPFRKQCSEILRFAQNDNAVSLYASTFQLFNYSTQQWPTSFALLVFSAAAVRFETRDDESYPRHKQCNHQFPKLLRRAKSHR